METSDKTGHLGNPKLRVASRHCEERTFDVLDGHVRARTGVRGLQLQGHFDAGGRLEDEGHQGLRRQGDVEAQDPARDSEQSAVDAMRDDARVTEEHTHTLGTDGGGVCGGEEAL